MPETRELTEEQTVTAAEAGHAAAASPRHSSAHHGGFHEEPHEGAPEWLISFADNVMLQMGFFVILLALAMKAPTAKDHGRVKGGETGGGPTPEQLDFALAVRQAFNNPVDANSADPRDFLLIQRLRQRAGGTSQARQNGLRGAEHDVQSIRRGAAYGVGGTVLFDANSTALDDSGQAAAVALADQFRGCRTILELRGHCSAAEAYGTEDRGMRLAYERALAVAQVLVSNGLAWSQLRLTACADSERVAVPAYDQADHRANQRVEVIQIDEAAPALDP